MAKKNPECLFAIRGFATLGLIRHECSFPTSLSALGQAKEECYPTWQTISQVHFVVA
jgi:hypothetical protein